MSTQTQTPVRPVAGPTFKAAARLPVGGLKRQRIAALLGALADAGQPTATATELAARLPWDRRKVDALLKRLHADGYISPSRNTARRRWPRYRVAAEHLPAELRPQDTETAA